MNYFPGLQAVREMLDFDRSVLPVLVEQQIGYASLLDVLNS